MKHMERMNKRTKVSAVLGAVVISAALISGCSADPVTSANPSVEQEQQVKTVKTINIEKQKIGEPLEQVAEVVPSLRMDVFAKANGDVVQLVKKRGDYVNEGDVILKIDKHDVQVQRQKGLLSVKSAQAELERAQRDYVNGLTEMKNSIQKQEQAIAEMEKNYNKLRNDYDLGQATKMELEQMETQLNNQRMDLDIMRKKLATMESSNSMAALEVQLESSQLNLQEIDRSLQYYEVKAPVSGILTELTVVEKTTLSPGVQVGRIEQLNPAKITARLTEEAASYLRGQEQVSFYVPDSGEKMQGTITYLADVMNVDTKTYELNVEVPNEEHKLKPGTRVQLMLTEEEQLVLAVPTSSIVREGSDSYVFILKQDHVERRKVELGRLDGLNQEILSGVEEGERLVISGQHQLVDQETVKVAD